MSKRKDPRVERTKLAFRNAFLDLLETNPANELSVMCIADAAGYSRNAFYTHFQDKDDFVSNMIFAEAEKLSELQDFARYFPKGIDRSTADDMLSEEIWLRANTEFFEDIYENRQFWRLLLDNKISPDGVDLFCHSYAALREASKDSSVYNELIKNADVPPDWQFIYFVTAYRLIGSIRWWQLDQFSHSPLYMAKQKWNVRWRFT